MKNILPAALCNLYSKGQGGSNILKDIEELMNSLRNSTISIMKQATIFSKKAHSSTIEKLHRMKFKIGKGPSNPLSKITYNSDSIIHTSLSILSQATRDLVKYTGRTVSPENGFYPCFQVNASYYLETNHIIMPWGILQWPFYCKKAPLGWNHGGIGTTIAHEITHAFDLEGSVYSPRGIFKETWTRKDRKVFRKETRKVSKFFKKFTHYGKHLNAEKTLSEDWADLGGIKIALHALNCELDMISPTVEQRKEAHRNFFIAYAISWRTLIRKQKLLFVISESIHSPAEDRVDRIVPQFQEWVDAFDVKPGDKLFIPVKDRLKFF